MGSASTSKSNERRGDAVAIGGDYQYRALTQGPAVQRYWHALKIRYIERFCLPESGDVVLDIGCGSGVISDCLAQTAGRVTGVDGNERAVEFARKTFTRPNLEFLHAYVEDANFDSESVDRVYCLELVEHVYERTAERLLRECHRILKSAGQMFLTTPNYRGLWPAVEFAMDKLRLAPQMSGKQHVTHYTRAKLRASLQGAGFSIRTLRTFSTFAPFCAFWPALADWLDAWEMRCDLPFGNILLAVVEKQV